MRERKFLVCMGWLTAVLLLTACAPTQTTITAEPPEVTSTSISPTSLPPTPTATSIPPTPTLSPMTMNEDVCNKNLCINVTGAGDLGKSFVFDAPEGFHFLGIAVNVENLSNESLRYTNFAEKTRIAAQDSAAGFVTFIINGGISLTPVTNEIGGGQTEELVMLFAVSDEATEFTLIHDEFPPIVLEIKK